MTSNPAAAERDDTEEDIGSPTAPDVAARDAGEVAVGRSLTQDAWRELRRRPLFLLSAALIAVVLVMAAFPQLFTNADPFAADLGRSNTAPSLANGLASSMGYDLQGYSVYARSVYGARNSILIGVLATVLTTVIGIVVGMISAYAGGIVDSLLSRLGEVFLGLPFILGAIVILTTFSKPGSTITTLAIVIGSLSLLGWAIPARVMRSSVLQAKQNDYVAAARSMGAGRRRIMVKHLLPNALSASLVYATISLGVFIGAEATLSYLGVGVQPPAISWGTVISDAQTSLRTAPYTLFFPALFLTITVLAFVILGDVVREAFDPKLH